ncbi:MAG: NAD(P)-dependent alcohol dehydrogenase [Brevinematales bacterium]|nr:NAD(P)-dependent alcohol dehydrogenase [Brevinematales bacterium]
MKAIICDKYGLAEMKMEEVEKPVPKDNEVLVEVHASSVTTHNLIMVAGKPYFVRLMDGALRKPSARIPGSDIAGLVTAVGKSVTLFKPGDKVFGDISEGGFGGLAEYVSVPENMLTLKPVNLSYADAAAVPQASLVALQGLRDKGNIQKGQKVLIYGASGGIGTFAVQLAKYFGAEVTGVCGTRNFEMVRSIGADHVIDYSQEDYTKSGQRYDLIFAVASRSIFAHKRALTPQGIYVSTGSPSLARVFQDMLLAKMISRRDGKKIIGGWVVEPNKDLGFIKELIEAGKIKPVIGRIFPFNETAEAFRYFGEGHPGGKVIITIEH